jgi:uncharacterized protein YxjI
MNPAFQFDKFVLKKQKIALTGKVRFYDPSGKLALFSEQKMFKLKEDIRVFGDEAKTQELLSIKARKIMDFAAAYDVVDTQENVKVGVLRRKGWKSMVRDEWEVLDVNDQPIGKVVEDSAMKAMLRRLLLGSLLPQVYNVFIGEQLVAALKQKFTFFGYEMTVDFTADGAKRFDHRLGLAAAVMMAMIEGKQSSY